MIHADLNCDLGEGGPDDDAIIPLVTSVNIACGAHAGGPPFMRRAVEEARRHGVAAGAHPGFPDREHFGRAEMPLSPDEIYDLVALQVSALLGLLGDTPLAHVKAHGGLYHMAARRPDVAEAVARAVLDVAGPSPIIVGLAASAMEGAARRAGLRFASEVFADRSYDEQGRLVPRSAPDALVAGSDEQIAARALAMVRSQAVPTRSGASVPMAAQTLCLHGDDARAAGRAAAIRAALERGGITVAPLGAWL